MLQVLMFHQDDPRKCTAAKMVKFGMVKNTRSVPGKCILLDPFAEMTLLPVDKSVTHTIVAVDCSWNQAVQTFSANIRGIKRCLPPLLAGNPVNYSKIGKLTTVEALAASLFILGSEKQAFALLNKFKWGHTFYELNQNLLEEYSKLTSSEQIPSIMRQYGLS